MVSNRTITNVSIPKRRGIQFLPEVLEVKRPLSAPDPIAQRTETGMIDTSGLQGEPVGTFYDFELVAGPTPRASSTRAGRVTWRFEVILTIKRNRLRVIGLRNTRKDAKQG